MGAGRIEQERTDASVECRDRDFEPLLAQQRLQSFRRPAEPRLGGRNIKERLERIDHFCHRKLCFFGSAEGEIRLPVAQANER